LKLGHNFRSLDGRSRQGQAAVIVKAGVPYRLVGGQAKARDAVHIVFAEEGASRRPRLPVAAQAVTPATVVAILAAYE
jgi:hypothetical protein